MSNTIGVLPLPTGSKLSPERLRDPDGDSAVSKRVCDGS
jgi:hypothetical protein